MLSTACTSRRHHRRRKRLHSRVPCLSQPWPLQMQRLVACSGAAQHPHRCAPFLLRLSMPAVGDGRATPFHHCGRHCQVTEHQTGRQICPP